MLRLRPLAPSSPSTSRSLALHVEVLTLACGLGLLLAAGGCGQPTLQAPNFASIAAGNDDPADADAVVLFQRRVYLSQNPPARPGSTEVQEHRALKILTEAAFVEGASHIVVPSKADLIDLRARTVSPRGEVFDVDVSTILSSTYSSGDGDGDGDTRSFQFPRVEVGSILETISTVRYPYAWWSISDDVAEKYPVRHYQVEIRLDKFAKPDLYVSNAKPELSHTTNADGTQLVSFELRDIPPTPDDWYRPHSRELGPWWIYRTIEWRYPQGVADGISSWSRAVGTYHSAIVDDEDVDGFAVRGADTCGDDGRCLAAAALQTLHEDVKLSGFSSFGVMRPLKEVRASQTANNNELALALWKMLKDRGVDARIALSSRFGFAPIIETFPSSAWLNHALVWMPETQKDDDVGIFIDPSCEACALGTLPSWSHGARAIVLGTAAGERGDILRASPFQTIHGTPGGPPATERVVTMRVDAVGDVEMEYTITESNAEAVDRIVSDADDSDDDAKAATKRFITGFSKSAELREYTRWRCDRSTATCTQRLVIGLPGFATVSDEGSSLLVPAAGLVSSFESWFQVDEDDPRRAPIKFTTHERVDDTLTIHGPAGWEFVKGTRPTGVRQTEGLTASLESTLKDNVLVLKRGYVIQQGTYPVSALPRFAETLADARTFRRESVTLNKKAPSPPPPTEAPATTTSPATTTVPETTTTATATTTTPSSSSAASP